LWEPNGLWIPPNGMVYILDMANGKIRRLDTNGMISTLFTVPGGIAAGRGLWVAEDESLAFVSSGTVVKKWTPAEGVTDYATGFVELGNLVIDPWGKLVVTDRRGDRVWRIEEDGSKTVIAGTGSGNNEIGGGDGQLAIHTGLSQVRGVWFLPTGAYFVATHRGSQVWYVDTEGHIHLFLHGLTSDTHAGDGTWFYNPAEPRVSEIRAITADHEGNLLITEHDSGYIRKVEFLRHTP
jgi:sugar lactone lactonase YvrE